MTQTKHTPEEEFAVVIAALLAGKIDGQQAVASAVALSRRFGSDERQAISQRLHSNGSQP